MLTHRTNILILSIFLLVLGLLIYTYQWSPGILIAPILFFITIEVIGASWLSVNFHFTSIYKAETNEKIVSITFDDGPHGVATEKVLAALKDCNAKAAFFCIGKKISAETQF